MEYVLMGLLGGLVGAIDTEGFSWRYWARLAALIAAYVVGMMVP